MSQPPTLAELVKQQEIVSQFEEALRLVESPVSVEISFEPLKNLQNLINAEKDTEARARRLEQAQISLKLAKERLAALGKQWAEDQAEADREWKRFDGLLQKFNALSEQQAAIAEQMLEQFPSYWQATNKVLPNYVQRPYLGADFLELIRWFEVNPTSYGFSLASIATRAKKLPQSELEAAA